MIKTKMDAMSAVQDIRDGDTVMIGGFGSPGTPFTLIMALLDAG